jgi:hypothetical protein
MMSRKRVVFTGAIRADDSDDAARRQAEGEVFEQEPVVVALGQALGLDHEGAEARTGRHDQFKFTFLLGHVFLQHRLIGADAGLGFGDPGLGGLSYPFQFAGHGLLAAVLGALLDRGPALFLFQPARIVALPRDAVPPVQLENPLRDVVEKVAIVGHGDDRALIPRQVLFEPLHTFGVEMVGGLVEQQDGRLLQQEPGKGDAPALAAGELVHLLVARRAAQGVHGHLDLGGHVPGPEVFDLLLQIALTRHDALLGGVVGGVVQFIPGRVVGGHQIGQVFYAFLHAGPHGGACGQLRLLFKESDRITVFEVDVTVDLGVATGEDAQQR